MRTIGNDKTMEESLMNTDQHYKTDHSGHSVMNYELHAYELLLMSLHKYIANQHWHTGLGGKRVFIFKPVVNEKGEQKKDVIKKITVPHHVYHQLRVIDRYLLIRTNQEKRLSLVEMAAKARLAVSRVFKDIPEHATRRRSAISQFFKHSTRYDETQHYYELFVADSKDKLLTELGLEQNETISELLNSGVKLEIIRAKNKI